jgi:hypothetical protein
MTGGSSKVFETQTSFVDAFAAFRLERINQVHPELSSCPRPPVCLLVDGHFCFEMLRLCPPQVQRLTRWCGKLEDLKAEPAVEAAEAAVGSADVAVADVVHVFRMAEPETVEACSLDEWAVLERTLQVWEACRLICLPT